MSPSCAADEEAGAAPPPPVRDIALDGARRARAAGEEGDDDAPAPPSERASLRAPSTLTPSYYDPELWSHRGFTLAPSGGASTRGIARSRRVLVHAASALGFLAMGAIFGADLAFVHSGGDERTADADLWREAPQGHERARQTSKAHKRPAGREMETARVASRVVDDDPRGEDRAPPPVTTPHMISALVDEWRRDAGRPDVGVAVPRARVRCSFVADTFAAQNRDATDPARLREKYLLQSEDPNVFYRATARLFWRDFGAGHWGREQGKSIHLPDLVALSEFRYGDGTPLSPKSTHTWITGDQVRKYGGFSWPRTRPRRTRPRPRSRPRRRSWPRTRPRRTRP